MEYIILWTKIYKEEIFVMMKSKKKVFIPILVLLLVAITGGTVLAAMPNSYYNNFEWRNTFRQNSINNYYPNETRLIQRVISSVMTPGFAVDGIFGPNTKEKVETYQGFRGLSSDGIVGPNTWGDFQNYPQWSRVGPIWSANARMYFYEYKTVHDSKYYIRHYADGKWHVQDSKLVWWKVN